MAGSALKFCPRCGYDTWRDWVKGGEKCSQCRKREEKKVKK